MKVIFDTNIIIDYLKGIDSARDEFNLYDSRGVSIITWMEVMVGADSKEEEDKIRSFLSEFDVVFIDQQIAQQAILIRKQHRLRLPDAIIWATAKQLGRLLVTRNTRDFPSSDPSVRVPYLL